MYRRPRFQEVLHEIRQEMSREADYDVELFAEMIRQDSARSVRRKRALQTEFGLRKLLEREPTEKSEIGSSLPVDGNLENF